MWKNSKNLHTLHILYFPYNKFATSNTMLHENNFFRCIDNGKAIDSLFRLRHTAQYAANQYRQNHDKQTKLP